MKIDTTYFPLPYIHEGLKRDGSFLPWPPKCSACRVNSCMNPVVDSVSICSFGFNYQRLSPEIVVAGFLLREWAALSPARKKNLHEFPHSIVSKDNLGRLGQLLSSDSEAAQKEIDKEKNRIIKDYLARELYKLDFLEPLKERIAEGLSFVHDYKQIDAQIAQNINVIIETRYEGTDFEERLEKATEQERAIYMAAKLLEEKLNVARLLVDPQRINAESDFKKFRFHGILIKYRRIYTPYIMNKRIDLQMIGQSRHEIIAHPEAVGVIPHTLIDNAIKYSPKGGTVVISTQDQADHIDFSVASYGPRILPDEADKIFQPFYRGQAARKQEEEGAGYGLYVSQLVAKEHLGSLIRFEQDPTQKPHFGHWTTFSVDIPLSARVLSE